MTFTSSRPSAVGVERASAADPVDPEHTRPLHVCAQLAASLISMTDAGCGCAHVTRMIALMLTMSELNSG